MTKMTKANNVDLDSVAGSLAGISLDIPAQAVNMAKGHDLLGPWLVEPSYALGLARSYRGGDTIVQHVSMSLESAKQSGQTAASDHFARSGVMEVQDGNTRSRIGVIEIDGALSKRGYSGEESSSTAKLRARVRQMRADDSIEGIVLRVDSPGGTIGGVMSLAREVRAASQEKTVVALVEDMAASAAYWVASQASVVMASNETASVGSIGVYILLYDFSENTKNEGIRPVLVRSNPNREDNMKGLGAPGVEITEQMEQYLQDRVQTTHDIFAAEVAQGRGITRQVLSEYENGQVFYAGQALADKSPLLDQIGDFDQAVSFIMGRRAAATTNTPTTSSAKDNRMATENNKTKETVEQATAEQATAEQATAEQSASAKPERETKSAPALSVGAMKQRYPKASAEWMLNQIDKGHTQEQADDAYRSLLESQLEAAEQAREQAKTQVAAAQSSPESYEKRRSGVPAIQTGATDDFDGDPKASLEERTEELVKRGKPRHEAWAQACRENPEAREAYVNDHNQQHTANARR